MYGRTSSLWSTLIRSIETYSLARSKLSDTENLDDPVSGATTFPIESYRQGATNEISKAVQDDPLALLTFLDRLILVEGEIKVEDGERDALAELAPKIARATANVTESQVTRRSSS